MPVATQLDVMGFHLQPHEYQLPTFADMKHLPESQKSTSCLEKLPGNTSHWLVARLAMTM
jgi:hypothetical protein